MKFYEILLAAGKLMLKAILSMRGVKMIRNIFYYANRT
jgi:hypothetical protein